MKKMTYKQAGVDVDKANKLIKTIRPLVDSTRCKGSMDSLGGFGGFFDMKPYGVKDPILVSATDGVGTKLKIAIETGKHDTVGIDLVAMSVNDCICTGAKPLFFLDYFASGRLEPGIWKDVLKGIVKGCKISGCALLGGETAEMPGMYSKGDYDLAGFAVGIVDRKKVIDGRKIKHNDVILGLRSSGPHSNGYSLIRKIYTIKELVEKRSRFLKPTQIYVKPVLDLIAKIRVKGISHITGGGFYDNIPRMLPADHGAVIEKGSWTVPVVFRDIAEKANIEETELYRTFNMGIGMALVIDKNDAEKAVKILRSAHGVQSSIIGSIVKNAHGVRLV